MLESPLRYAANGRGSPSCVSTTHIVEVGGSLEFSSLTGSLTVKKTCAPSGEIFTSPIRRIESMSLMVNCEGSDTESAARASGTASVKTSTKVNKRDCIRIGLRQIRRYSAPLVLKQFGDVGAGSLAKRMILRQMLAYD